jgi:hypothetical protein
MSQQQYIRLFRLVWAIGVLGILLMVIILYLNG